MATENENRAPEEMTGAEEINENSPAPDGKKPKKSTDKRNIRKMAEFSPTAVKIAPIKQKKTTETKTHTKTAAEIMSLSLPFQSDITERMLIYG